MSKYLLPTAKWGLILGLTYTAITRRVDPDFGWHLTSGDWARSNGIPDRDIFTYTASEFRWINHEFVSDIIMSLLYSLGGYTFLAVIFAVIWAGALLISAPKARLGILLLALLAMTPYIAIRPAAFTVLLLATLLKVIYGRSKRLKLAIPLLFIIWANLHGGFIIGLFILLYFAVVRRSKKWLYIFLASFLATMINIYGPRVYEEVFRTLLDASLHNQITEWWSFQIFSASWPFIVVWVAGFWIFSRQKLSEWYSLPPILFLGSLSATRNIALFVIVSVKKVDEYYDQALKQIPKQPMWLPRLFFWSSTIAIYLVSIWGFHGIVLPFHKDKEAVFPRSAVAYLKKNGCAGNLFNDYNYGGYLIWKLPEQRVYIDGRMPSWRDEAGVKYIDRYIDIVMDKDKQAAEFERYNITCALVRNGFEDLIKRLKGAGWTIVTQENGATLLVAPASG